MISSDMSSRLESCLRFLCLSNDNKTRFLASSPTNGRFRIGEGVLDTDRPLLAICAVTMLLIRRFHLDEKVTFHCRLLDISALLQLLLEVRSDYAYLWEIDKTSVPVSGPLDQIWDTLRFLAAEAIVANGWSIKEPILTFSELVRAETAHS